MISQATDGFYTTRVTVELEIKTQFGAEPAVYLVQSLVGHIPAITEHKIRKVETNFRLHQTPGEELLPRPDLVDK